VGFWDTLNSFKRSTQVVLFVSLIAGVAALIVGLVLDEAKPTWLQGLNYLPNVWASLTGFLIGAPFALVVLATFTVEREERVAIDRVNQISALTWAEFRSAVVAFCSNERISALLVDAKRVDHWHDEAFKILAQWIYMDEYSDSYGNSTPQWSEFPEEPQGGLYDALRYDLSEHSRYFEKAITAVTEKVKGDADIRLEWSAVQAAWSAIDQYVRLQRREKFLPWFEGEIYADLRTRMLLDVNPLAAFMEVHEGRTYSNPPQSMSEALDSLKSYSDLSDDEIDRIFSRKDNNGFGWIGVGGYMKRAKEAAEFLASLRRSVAMVDAADWPLSASKPV
jgi:hypothetical protein